MSGIYREYDVQAIRNHFAAFGMSDLQAEQVTYYMLEGDFDPKGDETIFENLAAFEDDEGEIAEIIDILKSFGDDARLNRCMVLLIDYAHENLEPFTT